MFIDFLITCICNNMKTCIIRCALGTDDKYKQFGEFVSMVRYYLLRFKLVVFKENTFQFRHLEHEHKFYNDANNVNVLLMIISFLHKHQLVSKQRPFVA